MKKKKVYTDFQTTQEFELMLEYIQKDQKLDLVQNGFLMYDLCCVQKMISKILKHHMKQLKKLGN